MHFQSLVSVEEVSIIVQILHVFIQYSSKLQVKNFYGIITTDEAGTLDFSGVPAFLVTNVLKVHCSNSNYKGFR